MTRDCILILNAVTWKYGIKSGETIRRLEVKMAPGGSIYALKVGQSITACRQCSHMWKLPRLPSSPPSQLPSFFLLNYFLFCVHTPTWRHILVHICASFLIGSMSKALLKESASLNIYGLYTYNYGYSSKYIKYSRSNIWSIRYLKIK